jgi:LacI family transcriptional regulator
MRVTIEDIARLAGVSKATVSRVLNNKSEGVGAETRKRVQKIINDHEYKPNLLARGIVTSKTKTLGLILPDITNPFFPELIKAIEDNAHKNGYTVIIGNTDFSLEKEQNYINTFIANRVDGVILTSTVDDNSAIHNKLKKYGVPCVLLDRAMKNMDYDAGVFFDNEYALYISCEYLIKHGNKRIVLISGPPKISTSIERIEGYRMALTQYGLEHNKNLIKYGNFTIDSGYKAIKELHNEGVDFTAVLAANDIMAIGAIKALKEIRYKIPDQIEVIGFDNIDFAEITDPPLSTIQQPTYEMGRKAVEFLLMLMDGKTLNNKHIKLQPRLICRSTTR